MKLFIILLLLFTFSVTHVFSQEVRGVVIDGSSAEPLENVYILISETGAATTTNAAGEFQLAVDSFPITLKISAVGYANRTLPVETGEQFLNITIDPVAEGLSEVIIRSTLLPAELRKIPAAVGVISAEDLTRIDQTNFAQAFNNVPGIYVNQGALNTTKLNIRGIGARSQYSTNRIQAYFDGIPLTSAEGELTLDDIDPEALGGVEIIKGPNSSIYGAGLGGVINLYSREPAINETRAEVRSLFGSYNMRKQTLTASHGSSNSSIFVNYNDLRTDGYRDNGEYSRQSALASARLKTTAGNTLSILANFTRLKAYIPSSINEDDFLNEPTTAAFTWGASRGFESYDRGMLGASYEHNFSGSFTNLTSVFLNFRDAYEPRPFDILKEEQVSTGARTRFNWGTSMLGIPSQLSFGAEYYKEWYETGTFENLYREFEGQGSVLGERLSNNEQDRNYINFFSQVRLEVTNRLNLEAGFNLNSTQYSLTDLFVQDEVDQTGDYRFNAIFSPRLGASYEIGNAKNLYASLSHGFSTPTVAETLTPEGQINTSLETEKGFNYEIGFKGNWLNNALYTEVALYSIRVRDLLVAQRVAEDRYVGINAGRTHHNGAEFLVSYNISTGNKLRLRPYVNGALNFFEFDEYLDRENDFSGNKLPGVPEYTVNIGLDAGYGNFRLFNNLLAVGEIPLNDDNNAFTNPYSVLNVKAVYDLAIIQDLRLNLSAGVNNVFDENYAASVLPNAVGFGGAAPRYYYPGNDRNYFAGVGLNYIF
ncbi:TonB-dependent receptor [Antarcticibacterium flavum]|uniref:TonB-dependent receptor n=1 Tax=Antarcticibacterium flavum TaxID=2058175 RepID=A0A5B7X4K8_9FLAO|nr:MULTISPECIES: TonB-dependent receptor [Antarcticibacterium]MCM4159995.1 TonB-dependent receptor [Antarcticibacterium sp. W02-3]QCY70414.1 TonB-dependent receptor [Antarcticibacterium flavum]